MKTRQFLCVCLTVFGTMAALNACKTEKKQYGEPVWGTVTESEPVAQTTCGAVRGENRDGIAIFRGIPYGAPVDGEGRFLPAAPAQPWEGVRDCTKNGPAAIQAGAPSISGNPSGLGEYFNGGHPERFGVAEEVKDENCLVLNVLTPGIDQAKRPVVVYIHGGGFASGTGTLTLGADGWAREEDIVIVGVNHRLNVFGFLYLGDLDPAYASSGMAGMLDLVLALRWVKDNIASFGGDPDCVTIMGESGGGMKVSTLMAMDAAHGLFSKAIVESGSNVVGNFSKEAAAAQTERLLKALGLTHENWKQLLTLPAEEIYAASAGLQLAPVADDINLKYIPGNEILAYDISKDIPLMVGSSADEMGVFVPIAQMGITEENLVEKVAEGMHVTPEKAARLVEAFKAADKKGNAPWHTYLNIVSMASFLGGGAFHEAMAYAAQGGAPVFHYLIEYDAPAPFGEGYDCAWHTADLPLQMRVVLHPESEFLSRQMAHAWAAFIRTGDPSTKELPWPAFTTDGRQVMVFDTQTRVETDPTAPYRSVDE